MFFYLINSYDAGADAPKEILRGNVVEAAKILNSRVGHRITWSESGYYFQAKVGSVSANPEPGKESLTIAVAEAQAKTSQEGEWVDWDGPVAELGFAQSQLSVTYPVDGGNGEINIGGTAYGPSRIVIE
ncbi:hypothetical protein KA017_02650 [Candidatus Woesebacteria bacterium]|nr:hypothetical protein [Candidatus Woesebacteria bacterium]